MSGYYYSGRNDKFCQRRYRCNRSRWDLTDHRILKNVLLCALAWLSGVATILLAMWLSEC